MSAIQEIISRLEAWANRPFVYTIYFPDKEKWLSEVNLKISELKLKLTKD